MLMNERAHCSHGPTWVHPPESLLPACRRLVALGLAEENGDGWFRPLDQRSNTVQ
jgi:hypothetical protein